MEESEADEPYDPSTPLSQNPTPPLEPQPQPPPPQDTPEVYILSWLHLIFHPCFMWSPAATCCLSFIIQNHHDKEERCVHIGSSVLSSQLDDYYFPLSFIPESTTTI